MDRCFLLLLSFSTPTHSIFCWPFHSGRTLKKWSLDFFWHRDHQHCGFGRLSVQWRYCPVRECAVLIWYARRASGSSQLWPLAFRHPVFIPGSPAIRPIPCFSAISLRALPLEVLVGSRERHLSRPLSVRVPEPFDPAGMWLLRRELGPLVGFSFPGTPLCAGHHRISMVTSGLAFLGVEKRTSRSSGTAPALD